MGSLKRVTQLYFAPDLFYTAAVINTDKRPCPLSSFSLLYFYHKEKKILDFLEFYILPWLHVQLAGCTAKPWFTSGENHMQVSFLSPFQLCNTITGVLSPGVGD